MSVVQFVPDGEVPPAPEKLSLQVVVQAEPAECLR